MSAKPFLADIPPSTEVRELTPRDLESLRELKSAGINLFRVKLSRLSPALGQSGDHLVLPVGVSFICVKRNGVTLDHVSAGPLQYGDVVFLAAQHETEETLREVFIANI